MIHKTRYICALGMISAMAYSVMLAVRIPAASFLTYDPKDVVLCLGGFLLGPAGAVLAGVATAVMEMVTVSDTGIVGALMNMMASACFAGTAAWQYRKRPTPVGAAEGLLAGTLAMTIWMTLWNYWITPLYLGFPREVVVPLLYTLIIPFNLVKGTVNTVLVWLLYRPVLSAVRRYGIKE